MMRARRWRLAAAAASVLVFAVAGCGEDDDPTEEPDSGYQSPLAEFFGWDEAAREEQPEFTEEDRQNHHEIEALVAECMNEAGFEYTAQPFWGDQQESFQDPHADVWQLQQDDPEEFARQYGYGMTTIDYEEESSASEAPEDPNVAYRDSLSAGAQQEYDRTLYGDEAVQTAPPEEDGEVEPVEPSGCYNDAYEQVYGDITEQEGQFESLHEEWGVLEERITNDPRMTEATQAWIGCMADAGYPDLETLYSGQDEVSQRQSELYGWDGAGESAVPLPVPEGGGEGEAGQTPSPPPEPDPAAVEELRQFEREIATADYTCKQEHGVEDVEHTVRDEQEQRFIDENREQLEAYRDWLNEQGVG